MVTAAGFVRNSTAVASAIAMVGSAHAIDNLWTGAVDNNWNDAGNWSLGRIPAQPNGAPEGDNFDDAVVSSLTNFPVISTNLLNTPRDIVVGNAGNEGRVDQNAGNVATGAANWLMIGRGAKGTYNVSGSGRLAAGNEFHVGYTAGGNGFLNVDTTDQVSAGGIFYVGSGGGTGTMTLEGGTVVSGADFRVGDGAGSNGLLIQNDGTINSGDELYVGQGGSNGEYQMNGGSMNIANWVAIGREGGTGVVNMSGGTITRTANGGSAFIVGANGPGTFNQIGGLVNIQFGPLWIGENDTAAWTLSGTGEIQAPNDIIIAVNGTSNSTVNFDGGTVTTNSLRGGGGVENVSFNGSLFVATAERGDFIQGLDTATIDAGGLLIDSAGFNIASNQAFGGSGGITKTGDGILTLSGASTFAGPVAVNQGAIGFPNEGSLGSLVSIADGAALQVTEGTFDSTLTAADVTFDGATTGTTLNLTLTDFGDGNQTNPLIDITGTLTVNGTVTLNFEDALTEVGSIPLISYATKAGAGTIELGEVPEGINATLVDDGAGLISLNVTHAGVILWAGDNGNFQVLPAWNLTNQNWYDLDSGNNRAFTNGDTVDFDDISATSDVVLNTTVNPKEVFFSNTTSVDYTLSGTGAIAGSAQLTKRGDGDVTISTANTFTAATRVNAGRLIVPTLPDGGLASPVGATSADPANLILGGGTLHHSGAAETSNRGFTIAGVDSGISSDVSLTLTGGINSTGGNLRKFGPGIVTINNGVNNIIGTEGNGLLVAEGTLTFEGSGSQINTVVGESWVGYTPDVPASMVLNDTTLNVASWFALGRGNGTTGTVSSFTATDSEVTSANFSVGFANDIVGNDADQNFTLNGDTTWVNGGSTFVSESSGSTAVFTLNDSASFTSNGTAHFARDNNSVATLNLNPGTTFQGNFWITFGRFAGSSGTGNVAAGALLRQNSVDQALFVSEDGEAVLNVDGTVEVLGTALRVAANAGSTGTVNLNSGGQITARQLFGGAGTSEFNIDGGTVIAAAEGTLADFVTGLGSVNVLSGGATFNSNGNDVRVIPALLDGSGGGGLTKTGAGNLALNGVNTYTGQTTVNEGSLGGNGSVAGALVVNSGAAVAPGDGAGTFTAGATTINGGFAFEADGATGDQLVVNGALTLGAGSTLNITALAGGLNQAVYIIADYTSLTGTFAGGVTGAAGYEIDYNYEGGNQIALVNTGGTAFDSWVAGFFPGETDPAIIGSAADPDLDGQSNLLEFALGGSPNSAADNAKIYVISDDSDDGDTDSELLMTIAVRTGTPAFAGAPSPTAISDIGVITVQGSSDLNGFAAPVSAVATVAPADAAPAGYEYRTFSLDGSNGLTSKGFLRVDVSENN